MVPRLTALLCLSFAALALSAHAAEPEHNRPMPRVEVGSHSAFIKKLSASRDGDLLLTVSDDKTARLWDANSGRLRRVLRVPLASGHEGQLFAGALSPDGALAAVGGFTGSAESGKGTVYLFDTSDGALHRRIADLPPFAIENISFSHDGRILALCFADGAGVMFFDWSQLRYLHGDRSASDKILGADFSPNGDFAITTVDGKLLIYEGASQYKKHRTKSLLNEGLAPMHVRYSPGGEQLVVGFDESPSFAMIDAAALETRALLRLPDSVGQRGLHVVDWSDDGRFIYAGGEAGTPGSSPILRWNARDRGAPQAVLTSSDRISDIRRLPGGAMAFSSGEPEIGVINETNRARWRLRGSAAQFVREKVSLGVSSDASVVSFAMSSGRSFTFDANASAETMFRQGRDAAGLSEAKTSVSGWAIASETDGKKLSLNGKVTPLESHERVRSWAFAPAEDRVVIGTSWALRSYDSKAQLQWRRPLPAEAIELNASRDGRMVVAAVGDGTIRWFRMDDGEEVFGLFAHRGGTEWIGWIPSGYYASSVAGDNFIGWHVNRGWEKEADFFRAIQFERLLYRPDIVKHHLRSAGRVDSAQNVGFDIAQLATIAPPRIRLQRLTAAREQQVGTATIRVSAETNSLPMQEWVLFVNGIPTTSASERSLNEQETKSFTRQLSVDLPAKTNRIRVESSNGRALGLAELEIEVDQPNVAIKGDLYIAAIGVSAFVDPKVPKLGFASRDAAEFVRAFESLSATKDFRSVKTWVRSDSGTAATSRAIESLPEFLAPATGNDTVIVFLASHGLSDPQGDYYFVPADGNKADIDRALAGKSADSLVRWDFFVDALSRTAGRRLLIVDTCSSGAIGTGFDVHSLAKRSMSSSFALITASKGDELSQEYEAGRHGLFTYGLLKALKEGFDPNADGKVSLSEAFEHAFDTVQTLRNRARGMQTPQMAAPDVLADMQLATSDKTRSARTASTLTLHGLREAH